jgi:hypothetical protein
MILMRITVHPPQSAKRTGDLFQIDVFGPSNGFIDLGATYPAPAVEP